jgi:glutathione S-transferase
MEKDPRGRVKALQWLHASEATFALHAIALLYARWLIPEPARSDGTLAVVENALTPNITNDIDWLEAELKESKGRFLLGDEVTAADVMMHFSLSFMMTMELGTGGRKWEGVERWVRDCEESEGFKRAVRKTGHKM